MTDKTYFQIYYGEGEILHGPSGVDLSMFQSVTLGISRPAERTLGGLKNWLARKFQLNGEEVEITVDAVTTRRTEGVFWELHTIGSTGHWRAYVEIGTERGLPLMLLVQARLKEASEEVAGQGARQAQGTGETREVDVTEEVVVEETAEPEGQGEQSAPTEPTGAVDEGEQFEEIVDLMEAEDAEDEEIREEDFSDDETGEQPLVPREWDTYDFEDLRIQRDSQAEWDYQEKEVSQGAIFPTKEAVMDAVKYWSLSLRREFRVEKSSRLRYDVKCVVSGCPWRVHAFKGKWVDYWKCSIVTQHNCLLEQAQQRHRNLRSSFVASVMYPHIVDNINFEPRSIIRAIEEQFQYKIRYATAWRTKQKALEMRFVTYEASYANLPSLLRTIQMRNVGTYWDLKEHPASGEDEGKWILQRVFFAFGPCINAFTHCRPVLCVDGTFLTGKYKGQILTAIAVDGNNQILPVAFAFVEGENTDS